MKKGLLMLCLMACLAGLQAQRLLKYNYIVSEKVEAAEKATDASNAATAYALAHPADPVAAAKAAAAAAAAVTANAAIPDPIINMDSYSSFTSKIGKGGGFNVLPSLKLMGDYYTKDKRSTFSFKIFVADANVDSLIPNKANQLYFPEASRFGLNAGGSIGIHKIEDPKGSINKVGHRFAFNYELYYLTKNIKDTSLKVGPKEANINMFQGKLGFEWAVVRDNISVFYNFNYGVPLTEREFYKAVYKYPKYNFVFNEVGLQVRAEIKEGFDGYVTFGSVIHSGDTRSLSGGSDFIVPYLRLGLNLHIFEK
jgi:hypothetical protein